MVGVNGIEIEEDIGSSISAALIFKAFCATIFCYISGNYITIMVNEHTTSNKLPELVKFELRDPNSIKKAASKFATEIAKL